MVAFRVLFRLCFEIQGIACYCRGSDNGDRMLGKLLSLEVKVDKSAKNYITHFCPILAYRIIISVRDYHMLTISNMSTLNLLR